MLKYGLMQKLQVQQLDAIIADALQNDSESGQQGADWLLSLQPLFACSSFDATMHDLHRYILACGCHYAQSMLCWKPQCIYGIMVLNKLNLHPIKQTWGDAVKMAMTRELRSNTFPNTGQSQENKGRSRLLRQLHVSDELTFSQKWDARGRFERIFNQDWLTSRICNMHKTYREIRDHQRGDSA